LLNEPKPDLFARYDPLVKTAPLYRERFDKDSGGNLTVRPVWIIGDLIVINEWLAADLKKTNWQLNQRRMGVMQHYKQILLSGNAQSFMLDQDNLPVMQIDLLPGILTNYPSQTNLGRNDYIINYLYKECFRDPELFRRCLEFMIRFIYTYPDIATLYIRILNVENGIQKLLSQVGFELLDLNNLFGKSLNIYKIDRSGT
jgi:hypothetical protein